MQRSFFKIMIIIIMIIIIIIIIFFSLFFCIDVLGSSTQREDKGGGKGKGGVRGGVGREKWSEGGAKLLS